MKPASLLAAFVLALAPAAPVLAADDPFIPRYVEETPQSGLTTAYAGDWEYMVGGGAAAFDCSGDGFPDLYLAGGEAEAGLYRNASTRGGPLRFEKIDGGVNLTGVTGAYPLDIDGDGFLDLAILRVGENVLMRGLGGCRFERANEAWGFAGGDGWSTAFAATWERGASWPTLAVGNYIDRNEDISPWGSCTDNWLHRPAAAGTSFAPPLPLTPSYCPLSIMFTDWNRSGTPDLRVSNDREYYEGGQEQLWHMPAGAPPRLYTEAEGWRYVRIWGMGIASADLDGNGYPEYFLTSMADNRLQELANIPAAGLPKPSYKETAFPKGVTAHRPFMGDDLRPSTAWHTQFEDVNNDGYADLFIAKGNVAEMPDFARKDPNNLLLQRPDGTFMEGADKAGTASTATSRGGALADFNLDGLIDIVVVNRWETAQIWRNQDAGGGGWLQVKLEQPGANRDAIGAWVEVDLGDRVIRREIFSGGGHASGLAGWWHFGLGTAERLRVRVIWPHGPEEDWQEVRPNQFLVLSQGRPARAWPAP